MKSATGIHVTATIMAFAFGAACNKAPEPDSAALALLVAPIGTVRVGLDEFSDREPIGGFVGADGDVLAHGWSP